MLDYWPRDILEDRQNEGHLGGSQTQVPFFHTSCQDNVLLKEFQALLPVTPEAGFFTMVNPPFGDSNSTGAISDVFSLALKLLVAVIHMQSAPASNLLETLRLFTSHVCSVFSFLFKLCN